MPYSNFFFLFTPPKNCSISVVHAFLTPPPPHTPKNVKNILKSIETQIRKSLGCRTAGMQGSYICTWYKNTPNVCVLQQKQREKLQSKQLHGYKKKKSNTFFF